MSKKYCKNCCQETKRKQGNEIVNLYINVRNDGKRAYIPTKIYICKRCQVIMVKERDYKEMRKDNRFIIKNMAERLD